MPWVEEPAESPHPDWDAFYAAGTPVPRIAELVGIREGTVRRHLERRRRVDPGLVEARAAAPTGASSTWYRHRDELRNFVATHGRFPASRGAEVGERALYVFLSEMRSAHLRQELGWQKAAALGCLGDFIATDLEVERDLHWRERLAEVVAFVGREGRMPAHRGTEGEEHSLGLFVVTQKNMAAAGRISEERLVRLDEALKGWRRGRGGAY